MAMVGEIGTATAGKSPMTGDRVLDSDEAKNANNVKEQSTKERSFRRGRSGGWYDKVFPLSQRLLSALISEREEEAYADRDSDSPLPPSSHSEMDYDRRDAEGESDVDNLKPESEWWSGGAMEGGYSEGSPIGGQGSRVWVEDQGWFYRVFGYVILVCARAGVRECDGNVLCMWNALGFVQCGPEQADGVCAG